MQVTQEAFGRQQVVQGRGRGRRLVVVLLVAAALLGVGLRLFAFTTDLARSPDERTYTRQANVLLAEGSAGFKMLGAELAADPAHVAQLPSPLRVGYLVPLTLWMQLTGQRSADAGAYLSLFCSILTLLLVAYMGWRCFPGATAIVATLYLAVLPFDLTVYRRAWEESYISLLSVATLSLCVCIARTEGRRRAVALAGLTCVGVLCLTTKETAGIAYLCCASGLALSLALKGDRRAAVLTTACAGMAVLGYLAALGGLFGGVPHALSLVRAYIHFSGIHNDYMAQYDDGPAWMFPAALVRVSPIGVLLGLVGFGTALLRARRTGEMGLPLGVAALTAVMFVLQEATGRYNFRFSASVYAPMCLLAGAGAETVLRSLQKLLAPLGPKAAWAILGVVLAVAALRDWNFAEENFLGPGLQDLALRAVLGVPPAPLLPVSVRASETQSPATGIAQMEAVERADPSVANRINLSLAYINADRPGLAKPLLDAVVAEDKTNTVAWNDRCVAHTLLHEYGLGVADCKQAVALNPGFQLAQNNLRWVEGERDKTLKALAEQEQTEPGKRDVKFYTTEGLNFLALSSYDRAIEAWRRALEIDPKNAVAMNNIGLALMMKKQIPEAEQYFERAIAADPSLQLAKANLAWAQSEQAKREPGRSF